MTKLLTLSCVIKSLITEIDDNLAPHVVDFYALEESLDRVDPDTEFNDYVFTAVDSAASSATNEDLNNWLTKSFYSWNYMEEVVRNKEYITDADSYDFVEHVRVAAVYGETYDLDDYPGSTVANAAVKMIILQYLKAHNGTIKNLTSEQYEALRELTPADFPTVSDFSKIEQILKTE